MYRIMIIPGFQQAVSGSEYRVAPSLVERVVCDFRARKSVPVVDVCVDAQEVKMVYARLEQLDWTQVVDLGVYNTVDDVEQILFIGDFGKVSIPVRYCIDSDKLSECEKNLCSVLLGLLKNIEMLDYVSVLDSPPPDPLG